MSWFSGRISLESFESLRGAFRECTPRVHLLELAGQTGKSVKWNASF